MIIVMVLILLIIISFLITIGGGYYFFRQGKENPCAGQQGTGGDCSWIDQQCDTSKSCLNQMKICNGQKFYQCIPASKCNNPNFNWPFNTFGYLMNLSLNHDSLTTAQVLTYASTGSNITDFEMTEVSTDQNEVPLQQLALFKTSQIIFNTILGQIAIENQNGYIKGNYADPNNTNQIWVYDNQYGIISDKNKSVMFAVKYQSMSNINFIAVILVPYASPPPDNSVWLFQSI